MPGITSNNTLLSVEFAAHAAGISAQCLRNWIEEGVPVAQPKLFVNGRVPVYANDHVEELRRYAHERVYT